MPNNKLSYNKIILDNSLNTLENEAGITLIDREDFVTALQQAWKKDASPAKVDFVQVYGELFRKALGAWAQSEAERSIRARGGDIPAFGKMLQSVEKNLKLSAMAVIPELRTNADVLHHMTFGSVERDALAKEFTDVTGKLSNESAINGRVEEIKKQASDKYLKAWENMLVRNITSTAFDKEMYSNLTRDERIEYAFALSLYKDKMGGNENENARQRLSEGELELINDALSSVFEDLKYLRQVSIEQNVTAEYSRQAHKTGDINDINKQVEDAVNEYNRSPNPANEEIEEYKRLETSAAQEKAEKEKAVNMGLEDEAAYAVGDLFGIADTEAEISGVYGTKEKALLNGEVDKFNATYKMRVGQEKLRTSVDQVARLMLIAREEKEKYHSPDKVVVIENGKETLYSASEYYKAEFAEAQRVRDERMRAYEQKLAAIEKDAERLEEDEKLAVDNRAEIKEKLNKEYLDFENLVDDTAVEREVNQRTSAEEARLKEKKAEIEERKKQLEGEIEEIEAAFTEATSVLKGGIVVEKNGNTVNRYKTADYFDTHETAREQYAYKEYQKTYGRVFADACQSAKENCYSLGKSADLGKVARDVEKLFRIAMFETGIYDNEKNAEIVEKCSFGGFSTEQLSSIATGVKGGNWAFDQKSEAAWKKQNEGAKSILSGWVRQEKKEGMRASVDRVKDDVRYAIDKFRAGTLSRKQLLEYTIATEAHMNNKFSTRRSRFFSFRQYRREKQTIKNCREALGLGENDSLRVEMSRLYTSVASAMDKENVFQAVNKAVENATDFVETKEKLESANEKIREKTLDEKRRHLEELKSADREPMVIDELDEKRVIVNQQPRSQPVAKQSLISLNRSVSNN